MIFVTVGTHEDPFDRLLKTLDELAGEGIVTEPVVAQSGYSKYMPRHFPTMAMLPYDAIQEAMGNARIVITHGGPASIMQALAHGKIPIVVPRQSKFGEHVDDHQVRFSRRLADRVIVVEDIATLGEAIVRYDEKISTLAVTDSGPARARAFALKLEGLCEEVLRR